MTTLSSLLPPVNIGNATGTLPAGNGGTGLTSSGTAGNLLTSNGTAWVSQAPVAGSPSLQAIASGSLSDGSTVIVNADGTVSVVAGVTQAVGSPVVFRAASTGSTSATYDSAAQRVVLAYSDGGNSSRGTAIVGTVSGTSISFGTAVVFSTASTDFISATYDSAAQRVVIAYRNVTNNRGTAIVGTVSGTSISFGTAVVFSTASTENIAATYDSNAQRVVIAYRNVTNSGFGTTIVGTVSGTSISFGTAVVFNSASTTFVSATYDSAAQRVVIAYRDGGNASRGTAIVGTVSGTSISFGTPVVFRSEFTDFISATYDSAAQRVVIAYRDTITGFGTAIVGTVSGTSVSFGSSVVFNSENTETIAATYDNNAQRVVIAYMAPNGFGNAIVGTVSGTSISFGAAVVFQSANTQNISTTYDSAAQRVVIAYRNQANSGFGTSVVFRNASTNLTNENFIGFSDGAYTNGQTATIQIDGAVDDAQSGLVPGQSYFVQGTGTLGLTPASPSVFAGTAVAANRIIVKG
jgi:hypothetical protein